MGRALSLFWNTVISGSKDMCAHHSVAGAARKLRAKTQLGLDPDTAALIFPSPHEVGRRCAGGADEGLFLRETRWQSRRRFVVVQSTLRQQKPPSSATPGHLLPVEGRGEGNMGGLG